MIPYQFSVDDASLNDIRVAELFVKYGMQDNVIFYFPVMPQLCNEPKGRQSLTLEQMQDIASIFQIGSHSISHRLLSRIPLSEAKDEVIKSRQILQERFEGQEINSFCYPRGYSTPEVQKFVQEAGYTSARSVVVGYIYKSENPFFEQVTSHCGYDRKEYGGQDWFTYSNYMLNQVKNTPGAEFKAFLHSWELAAYPRGFQLFEELLKELTNA